MSAVVKICSLEEGSGCPRSNLPFHLPSRSLMTRDGPRKEAKWSYADMTEKGLQ
jgi:hypothetical protein